jgi:hypothetical protein
MKTRIAITTLLLTTSFFGCSAQFAVRDANAYRQDTRALLETKNGAIKDCYDAQLKAEAKPIGKVVVNFVVQEETGQIINVALDTQKTTAPEALSSCVVDAISGLNLDPADQNQGVASFEWEFNVKS